MFAPLAGADGLSGNYFLGGKTRVREPVSAPQGRAPSARQPNRPGQPTPSGQTPFPSSAAKPGNREGNQRIPYARYQFTWMDDIARPREMQTGDVCFVHKMSQAMGRGHNRTIKVTGLPQLNDMLAKPKAGVTTLDFADPLLAARVRNARIAYWTDALEGAKGEEEAANVAVKHYGDREPWKTALTEASAKVAKYTKLRDDANASTPSLADINPETDWTAVRMLSEWTLDGLLINVDDEVDVDDTNQPQLSRDDGVLMNVCIQGPTPMRNTQHVDQNIPVLDKVFVGLIAQVVEDGGTFKGFSFLYKLFSGRQLHTMHLKRTEYKKFPLLVAAPFAQGPSEEQFEHLVGAWRVGSVLDNKLTTGAERMMTVNVCVEWWTLDKLRREYDEKPEDSEFGKKATVAPAAPAGP